MLPESFDVDDIGANVEVFSHIGLDAECFTGVMRMSRSEFQFNNLGGDCLLRIKTSL